MAVTGLDISDENRRWAIRELQNFFAHGSCRVIREFVIRSAATKTIIAAICAFNEASIPLVTALTELLNAGLDLQSRQGRHYDVSALPVAFQEFLARGASEQVQPLI